MRLPGAGFVVTDRPALAPALMSSSPRCSISASAPRMGHPRRKAPISDLEPRALAAVDLCWWPLGAGGHFVRLNGRIYEAIAARIQRRPRCDLYHRHS